MTNLKDTFKEVRQIDLISNKRSLSPELIKAYITVYNFLYERINDEKIIPKLNEEELIRTWISNRNWLMIPPKDCDSREDALKSEYPNIWIYYEEDLSLMDCGLHWAQSRSVDNFLTLVNPLNYGAREKLDTALEALKKDKYFIIAQEKIHDKGLHRHAPARFERYKEWRVNQFNDNVAKDILKTLSEIRVRGKNARELGQVNWLVPTAEIRYGDINGKDYQKLLDVVKDYIGVLKVCHETLTQSQMRKIERNIKKDFDYEKIKKKYDQIKLLLNLGRITEEYFIRKKDELNNKIKQYNIINGTNLELLE